MTVDTDHPGTLRRIRLELLPVLAFVATFGVFFLDKSREARSVLRSGRGVAVVAAILLSYLVLQLVLRRATRQAWVGPVVRTFLVLGLAVWVVRPYYADSTTNRRLLGEPVPAATGPTGVDPAGLPASPALDQPVTAGPGAEEALVAAGSESPVLVASAPIVGIGHSGRGTASLLRAGDGSLVVRLTNFDIEGVPDPRVHLVRGDDVRRAGGTDLGRLPGNRGTLLDIAVPQGVAAGPGWTVLVWCRAFAVPVANASLEAPGITPG